MVGRRRSGALELVAHRAVAQLQTIDGTIDRLLVLDELNDRTVRTGLVDVAGRIQDVAMMLGRELERHPPNRRYVGTLLTAAGLAVAQLADVHGALEAVGAAAPLAAELAGHAGELAGDLLGLGDEVELAPGDLWPPGDMYSDTYAATYGGDGKHIEVEVTDRIGAPPARQFDKTERALQELGRRPMGRQGKR